MRWLSPKVDAWANRYVRVFAWTPRYDWDREQWVWLERVHVRQYWDEGDAFDAWRDFHPSDKRYANVMVREPVSDSRKD
jgi:hypothetical protein